MTAAQELVVDGVNVDEEEEQADEEDVSDDDPKK